MADPTANDLITSIGRIDPADWWPDLSLSKVKQRLDGFLQDGTTQAVLITDTAKNRTARIQWAYYRAADEVFTRLAMNPSSVDVRDEGSSSMLVTQIQMVKDIRDEAKAAFDELLAEATEDEIVIQQPGTFAVPISFRF